MFVGFDVIVVNFEHLIAYRDCCVFDITYVFSHFFLIPRKTPEKLSFLTTWYVYQGVRNNTFSDIFRWIKREQWEQKGWNTRSISFNVTLDLRIVESVEWINCRQDLTNLTHFKLMLHFYSPWYRYFVSGATIPLHRLFMLTLNKFQT